MRRVVGLLPSSWEARSDLGALLGGMGNFEEATAQFREALKRKPDAAIVHNDLGYLFFLQGKFGPAIDEYQQALRIQPDLELARTNLAEALRQKAKARTSRGRGP